MKNRLAFIMKALALILIVSIIGINLASCSNKQPRSNSSVVEGGTFGTYDPNDTTGTGNNTNAGSNGTTVSGSNANGSGATITQNSTNLPNLGGKTVKITDYFLPDLNGTSQMAKYIIKRKENIEKLLNCKIEFVNIPAYEAEFLNLMKGTSAVDIGNIGNVAYIPRYIGNKLITPLDGLGINFGSEEYEQKSVDMSFVNGKHYGVYPKKQGYNKITQYAVCFFNKKILENKGYKADDLYALQAKGQWTWDKFYEVAKAVTDKNVGITGAVARSIDVNSLMDMLINSNNATVLDVNIKTANVAFKIDKTKYPDNYRKAVEAMTFYQKLVKDGVVDQTTDVPTFSSGKAGFYLYDLAGATYPKAYNNVSVLKDPYGILYLPKGPSASDYVASVSSLDAYTIISSAPFLKGDDANHTKLKQLAAVLALWCERWIPVADESKVDVIQYQSICKDQGSLATIKGLGTTAKGLDSYEFVGRPLNDVNLFPNALGDLFKSVTKAIGTGADPSSAFESRITMYNKVLDDAWKIIRQ